MGGSSGVRSPPVRPGKEAGLMVQVGADEARTGAEGDRRRGEAGRNSGVGHPSALVCEAKQVVAPLPGVRIPAGAPTGGRWVADSPRGIAWGRSQRSGDQEGRLSGRRV